MPGWTVKENADCSPFPTKDENERSLSLSKILFFAFLNKSLVSCGTAAEALLNVSFSVLLDVNLHQ